MADEPQQRSHRIGFDVSHTCNSRAGCSWYADTLVREMAASFPESEFLLYHHFGSASFPNAAEGTGIDQPNVAAPLVSFSNIEARDHWAAVAAGTPPAGVPDLVQANFFDCPPVPACPVVFVVYDLTVMICPEFHDPGNVLICTRGITDALVNASGLLFISEHSRQDFERLFPGWLERSRIPQRVVRLASRGFVLSRDESPPSAAPWLIVGTVEPRKNHSMLLKAHDRYWERSRVRRPLVIAGSTGWRSDSIQAEIQSAVSRGRATCTGYVSEDELFQLYRDAFAFVYPSFYEGFGLPVLEAMARGVPVITSNASSLPEVGGDAVLYCDPNDPQSLADAMLTLEEDPTLHRNLSLRGPERASQFSWKQTALETMTFYAEVIEHWKRTGGFEATNRRDDKENVSPMV